MENKENQEFEIENKDELSQMFSETIFNSNERDLFIRTALYAEWVIDKWLEEKFNLPSETLDNRFFFYDLKLDILKNAGEVMDPYLYNLKEISQIRNRYAHKLEPEEESIKRMIQTMKKPPAGITVAETITPDKYPLLYFKLCSIGTINEMYQAIVKKRALTVK